LFYPFICIFHLEDQLYKKKKMVAGHVFNEILLDVICKPLTLFFSHLRFIPTPSFTISLAKSIGLSPHLDHKPIYLSSTK